jgi:cell division protein FtsW
MLMATGITALIAIQVFINIGVVTGCVPPTGVSLPFISAGRTSLIVFMASIGVLLNISRQRTA